MKKITCIATALLCAATINGTAQITTPYFYGNVPNNWSGNGISGEYRGDLGTKTWKFTIQAGWTGSSFYKIYNQQNNNNNNFNDPAGSKVWSGNLSINDLGTAFAYGDGNGGAGSFPVQNSKFYTFLWQDVSTANNAQAIVMETTAMPVEIVSVRGDYTIPGNPLTITATLSAAKSPEERILIRYTTNNFGTSSMVEMSCSGTTCTGTIPAGDVGNSSSHRLYILSSTVSSVSHANADLVTINYNNNGNANYQMSLAPLLPVTLTSFQARVQERSVRLDWSTASERDNHFFAVERSADGQRFEAIGRVMGNGSTHLPQRYTFTDEWPLRGLNYYRLRQVDYDGRFEYHKMVVADMRVGSGAAAFDVFPSPARERITLRFQAPLRQEEEAWLLDAQGRLLQRMPVANGATQAEWGIEGLPPGVYLVRMQRSGDAARFVKTP